MCSAKLAPARRPLVVLLLCVALWVSLPVRVQCFLRDCDVCSCKVDTTNAIVEVNCTARSLLEVPKFLSNGSFPNVTVLHLDHNKIESLEEHDFDNLSRLQTLDLAHNRISHIANGTFRHWTRLPILQLYLSHNLLGLSNATFERDSFYKVRVISMELDFNKFSAPPSPVLRRMTSLEYLYIRYNPMFILRSGAFDGLPRGVKVVDLSDCNLTTLEPGSLTHLAFLQDLYLNNNKLGSINATMFDFNVLGTLSLVNAGIVSIGRRTFQLPQLRELILDKNDFSAGLDRFVFQGLNLDSLYMRNCGLTSIKRNTLLLTIHDTLDLEGNEIDIIQPRAFQGLRGVAKIVLTNCKLKRIRGAPFENLTYLQELSLDYNALSNSSHGFLHTEGPDSKISRLYLSSNNLTDVPDLSSLKKLKYLYLDYNRIEKVKLGAFSANTMLRRIRLRGNRALTMIDNSVFTSLSQLERIDLSYTSLKVLPSLSNKPNLYRLNVQHSQLEKLPSNLCENCPLLYSLYANNNTLTAVPSFRNCSRLEILSLDANRIANLSNLPFTGLKRLRLLWLHNNNIQSLPDLVFGQMLSLKELYLHANQISNVSSSSFFNTTRLSLLNLAYNRIHTLLRGVFEYNGQLGVLYLHDNRLQRISQYAFPDSMQYLRVLDVSNNTELDHLPLPANGFPYLSHLRLKNLRKLYDVPIPMQVPRVRVIEFTYPYSCCVFDDYIRPGSLVYGGPTTEPTPVPVTGDGYTDDEFRHLSPTTRPTVEFPTDFPDLDGLDIFEDNATAALEEFIREIAGGTNVSISSVPNGQDEVVGSNEVIISSDDDEILSVFSQPPPLPIPDRDNGRVDCTPLPNDLTPCENLLGEGPALRILIWAVWVVAILGNIVVLFFIASGDSIKVPDFIICNLAVADFLMGVYLAFIAIVDIRTFGPSSFFKSALLWQNSPGCMSAGFIAVLSSMQSVYILVIITVERLQTVVYSFRYGSRMNWCHAVILVSIGWIFAAVMATLPLLPFDINSYTDVAVCLPIRPYTKKDKGYLGVLLGVNVISFLIILGSYLHMFLLFCKSPAANAGIRERICTAWKMAILVGTALVCWLPLTIVGVSALLDHPIIDLKTAKFLIVLILPINACLNPFLYAFVTQQFRDRIASICQRATNRLHSGHQSTSRRSSLPFTNPSGGSSPHGDIDVHLRNLRQSRRSNSCEMNNTTQFQFTPPLTRGTLPYMGRRNSSPAIFSTDGPATSPRLGMGLQLPIRTPAELTETSFTASSSSGNSEEYRMNGLSVVQEESELEDTDTEELNDTVSGSNSHSEELSRHRSQTATPSECSSEVQVVDSRSDGFPSPPKSCSEEASTTEQAHDEDNTQSGNDSHHRDSNISSQTELAPSPARSSFRCSNRHQVRIINPHIAKQSRHKAETEV